jgi:hypothetical protein
LGKIIHYWPNGNATLRSAFSSKKFEKKSPKKNLTTKKIHKKKIQKIFREFFFQIFVGYPGSTANLGCACEKFGSLGPLVWEEIENAQTVHNSNNF